MRQPSLNISFKDFKEITEGMLTEEQVISIFKQAAQLPPFRLTLPKTNAGVRKKVEKALRANDPMLFNKMLTAHRVDKGHKFIPIIKGDNQWNTLCDIAADCQEFADLFNLTQMDAYQKYISIGIAKMNKKYTLNKFKYYKDQIFDYWNKVEVASNDKTPEMTKKCFKYFISRTGLRETDDLWKLYQLDFIYLVQVLTEHSYKYHTFIDAQIDHFKGFKRVPEPSHLWSEEAIKRYLIYKK
jgi:hypothetical protein